MDRSSPPSDRAAPPRPRRRAGASARNGDSHLTAEQLELVEQGRKLIDPLGKSLLRRSRGLISEDELESHGFAGLLNAARLYDPSIRASFSF